jgi:hypothetical protein
MLNQAMTPVPSHSLGGRSSAYASRAANIALLDDVLAHLSVTKYQLADLLGVKPKSNLYSWCAGRRRPSALMLVRMMMLIFWQAEGLPVFEMRSIDWDTMTITMRPGARSQPGVNGAVAGRQQHPGPGRGRGPGPGRQQVGYPYGASGPVY